jgi:ferritin-like protein
MASESYHEPLELLSEDTKNMHRAIVSLREELDAADWYQQRAEGCSDPDLRAVIMHNKNEEIEHAMMVLEWIRRHDPVVDSNIRRYVNSSGPITQIESKATGAAGASVADAGRSSQSLGIGSLKEGI